MSDLREEVTVYEAQEAFQYLRGVITGLGGHEMFAVSEYINTLVHYLNQEVLREQNKDNVEG